MIGIVSSDAGGAELLSSYVRRNRQSFAYHLAGPAVKIFEKKIGIKENMEIDAVISQSKQIICGSSWKTDVEINAIKKAKKVGIRSIVFLDHWANYSERFTRNKEMTLPDEFWVGDPMAKRIAKNVFPSSHVRLVENPYMLDLKKELKSLLNQRENTNGDSSILYVCEPTGEHALQQHGDSHHWGYTELEALRYFLQNIHCLGVQINRVVIRPHPSETYTKYQWVEKEFELPIERGGVASLSEDIVEANIVVGCQTMAMVVGLLAKKRVVSSIPPWGKKCNLPHKEIEHLQTLVSEFNK